MRTPVTHVPRDLFQRGMYVGIRSRHRPVAGDQSFNLPTQFFAADLADEDIHDALRFARIKPRRDQQRDYRSVRRHRRSHTALKATLG
jgi:hypothetical protein